MKYINNLIKNNIKSPIIIASQNTELRITEGQCDACPPGISIKSDNKPKSYNHHYYTSDLNTISLNNEFNAAYGAHLTPNPLVLNQDALNLIKYFEQPKTLENAYLYWQNIWNRQILDDTFKNIINLNLIRPIDLQGFATYYKTGLEGLKFTESEETLTALLHITTSCNLSCDYCYLKRNLQAPFYNKGQNLEGLTEMPLSTGYKIIDAVFHSAKLHHFPSVKLKYTGGEPLLCFPKIQQLHEYANQLADKHHIELKGSVLSNGTLLTPQIIQKIKSLNLRLMISLDGLNHYHDCHRHFPDGTGSFQNVSRAIETALSNDLIPDISVTISSRNIDGLPELMAWILERDLPFSLNFYREGCKETLHSGDLRLEEEKIIAGMLAAYKVIESRIQQKDLDVTKDLQGFAAYYKTGLEGLNRLNLLASLADRTNLAVPHLRPCSVGHSYMVFDTTGNLYKCQMQMSKSGISQISERITHDPLTFIRQDKTGIQNPEVDDKPECKACEWKYWCAGGCPLESYRTTSRYDAKSPSCNIYKALFPEIIRIEGLRMLKTAYLAENRH